MKGTVGKWEELFSLTSKRDERGQNRKRSVDDRRSSVEKDLAGTGSHLFKEREQCVSCGGVIPAAGWGCS